MVANHATQDVVLIHGLMDGCGHRWHDAHPDMFAEHVLRHIDRS
ncbi:hypothetical protein [Trueperella sp.]